MRGTIHYLRRRFNERSTWVAIGAAITAASVIPAPWSYWAFVAGLIGTLVPDGDVKAGQ
ncbi:MAG: hypothetical protein QHC65_04295 [Sphingomonas sp.]|nr:hypothetical protein [Sphingomonas sp.]MDX3883619.1 hypothetical protein [Sphingomonas sp.]